MWVSPSPGRSVGRGGQHLLRGVTKVKLAAGLPTARSTSHHGSGMRARLGRAIGDTGRGIGVALRGQPGVFFGAATAVFALSILLPPALLSVARKPVDYFTFNPWLKRL